MCEPAEFRGAHIRCSQFRHQFNAMPRHVGSSDDRPASPNAIQPVSVREFLSTRHYRRSPMRAWCTVYSLLTGGPQSPRSFHLPRFSEPDRTQFGALRPFDLRYSSIRHESYRSLSTARRHGTDTGGYAHSEGEPGNSETLARQSAAECAVTLRP